jgi:[NiFe] hydrogenase assembly HybE family chaperone
VARTANPHTLLQQHYGQVWQTRMMDMPFVNAALQVEAIGFARHDGDWLGVIVTPWFLNLFLLNGGGSLWQDVSAGQRRLVNLPCGALQFIADDDPDLGLYQYCPLIAAVGTLSDHATAHQAALDAMQAVLTPAVESKVDAKAASRRGFFRKIGRRA